MKSEHKIAAVCWAVVILLLMASVARAAPKDSLGTFAMDPVYPHYGDAITLSWDNDRTARTTTVGILCRHDFDGGLGDWVYIAEQGVGRSRTGATVIVLDNEHSTAVRPGMLDYTRTAHCAAGMWNERQSTGKGPVALVPFISFDVEPQ